jgi:hypothetical protein
MILRKSHSGTKTDPGKKLTLSRGTQQGDPVFLTITWTPSGDVSRIPDISIRIETGGHGLYRRRFLFLAIGIARPGSNTRYLR